MARTALLQIGERRISGLVASPGEVQTVFSETLPEGDRVAAIRDILARHGFRETVVSLVIPRQFVILREFSVPGGTPEEIIRMVRFQVEKEMPLPLEKLRWTFVELGQADGRHRILAIAAPVEVVDSWVDTLSRAGLKVRACYPATMGLLQWTPARDDLYALGYSFDEAFEVLIVNRGQFAASNTISARGLTDRDLADEINRSVLSFMARFPNDHVKRLYLAEDRPQMRERLAETLHAEPLALEPAGLPPEAVPMMGLVRALASKDPGVRDLLKPPAAARKFRLGSRQRVAILAAGALIAAYLYLWLSASDREAELNRLKGDLKTMAAKYKALGVVKKQVDTAEEWSLHRRRWLDVVKALSDLVDTKEMYVVSLTVDEEGRVSLVGRAKNRQLGPLLTQKIEALDIFRDAIFDKNSPVDDKQGYSIEFSILAKLDWTKLTR